MKARAEVNCLLLRENCKSGLVDFAICETLGQKNLKVGPFREGPKTIFLCGENRVIIGILFLNAGGLFVT